MDPLFLAGWCAAAWLLAWRMGRAICRCIQGNDALRVAVLLAPIPLMLMFLVVVYVAAMWDDGAWDRFWRRLGM